MATPEDLDSKEFSDVGEDAEIDDLNDLDLEPGQKPLADIGYEQGDDDSDAEDGDDGDEEAPEDDDADETDLDDEDPEEEEESLDVILAREQDLEAEFAPTDEAGRVSPTTTPAGEDEFTCRSCFLVKRRAQLADADALVCLDCA